MARDGTVTVKITGDAKGLKDALDDSDGRLNKFGGKMGGVAKGVGKAFVGMGGAAAGFGVLSVKAFAEAEQVAAQTGAVLKSTGGIANVTAKDVDTLAGSLSAMSGVDDEAIAAGQNLLLTFTKVRNEVGEGNDIFDQATRATLDMSVALGTDMKSASLQLGKALNDPLKGISALAESGVSFTQAQKDQVKALVESGDTMSAQKIILKEMEIQFGGSAKAAGGTFAGQLNKLKVVAGNFMEDVGSKLVPILMDLGEWLGKNIPKAIEAARPTFERITAVVRDFVPVVQDVIRWIRDFVDKFRGGEGKIGESADKLGVIVGQIKDVFESAFEAIKAVVEVAVAIIKEVWDRFGNTLLEFIKGTWDGILEVFRGAFNIISGIFDLIKAVFTGKWGEAWEAIKKILDGAFDLIFGVIRNALTNVIPTLFGAAQALLSAAFGLIWNALKTVLSDAWDLIVRAIGNALGGVVNFFKDLPGRIVAAVGDLFGFVRDKMTDARDWVRDRIGDIVGFFGGLGGRILAAAGDFLLGIRDQAENAKTWIFGKVNEIVGFFLSIPGRIANVGKDILSKIIPDIPGAGVIGNAIGGILGKAAGGPVLAGTPYVVGEKGPELFIPGSSGSIIPAGSSSGSSAAGSVNHYSIAVTAIDPAAASQAVIDAIKEYERRNGTGWRVA